MNMTIAPSPNGSNGRDSSGRFTKGNPGGQGNPHARRVADFRRVLLGAVTDEDLHDIARTLVERGKTGDVMAAREVLDRLMGKAKVTMAVETEPQISIEEAQAKIRAIVERRPELVSQLAQMAGMRLLPAGSSRLPDADAGD